MTSDLLRPFVVYYQLACGPHLTNMSSTVNFM